ncbi:MAG: hypothetical protein K0S58_3516 [Nitrospira sp.]|nr:hypothetical protein [Nitrospira sp.]
MKSARFIEGVFGVLLMAVVSGCAGGTGSSVTLPSSAFFETDVKERQALHVVSRAQESRRANCQQNANCEELTYSRALVALFENREDAINAFEELRTTVPDGRYAKSSSRWILLLQGGQAVSARQGPLFLQLRQEVLHGLLEPDTLAAGRRSTEQERRIAEMRP